MAIIWAVNGMAASADDDEQRSRNQNARVGVKAGRQGGRKAAHLEPAGAHRKTHFGFMAMRGRGCEAAYGEHARAVLLDVKVSHYMYMTPPSIHLFLGIMSARKSARNMTLSYIKMKSAIRMSRRKPICWQ